jgi:hypothetical protein
MILKPEIVKDDTDYSEVTLRRRLDLTSSRESVSIGLDNVRDTIHSLIESYSLAFRVAFLIKPRTELSTGQ